MVTYPMFRARLIFRSRNGKTPLKGEHRLARSAGLSQPSGCKGAGPPASARVRGRDPGRGPGHASHRSRPRTPALGAAGGRPASTQVHSCDPGRGHGHTSQRACPRPLRAGCQSGLASTHRLPSQGKHKYQEVFCHWLDGYITTNVKNMHLHRDSNPGPWNTVPML